MTECKPGCDIRIFFGKSYTEECKNWNGRSYASQWLERVQAEHYTIGSIKSGDETFNRFGVKTLVLGRQLTEWSLDSEGGLKAGFIRTARKVLIDLWNRIIRPNPSELINGRAAQCKVNVSTQFQSDSTLFSVGGTSKLGSPESNFSLENNVLDLSTRAESNPQAQVKGAGPPCNLTKLIK
jgi:hypothetical protein